MRHSLIILSSQLFLGVPASVGTEKQHDRACSPSQVKDTSSLLFPVYDVKSQSSGDARDSRGDTRQVLMSKAGGDNTF